MKKKMNIFVQLVKIVSFLCKMDGSSVTMLAVLRSGDMPWEKPDKLSPKPSSLAGAGKWKLALTDTWTFGIYVPILPLN